MILSITFIFPYMETKSVVHVNHFEEEYITIDNYDIAINMYIYVYN